MCLKKKSICIYGCVEKKNQSYIGEGAQENGQENFILKAEPQSNLLEHLVGPLIALLGEVISSKPFELWGSLLLVRSLAS